MSAPVIGVEADTPLIDATRRFVDEEIHGAPVVDGNGRLVGFLSTSDLLRAAQEDRESAESAASKPLRSVTEVMETRVFTVPEDAPVAEVVDLLRAANLHRVIVMKEDIPVGMISSLDLLTLLKDL